MFIGEEVERLNGQIEDLSGDADSDADEEPEMARRAAEFTDATDAAAKALRDILAQMEEAQQNVTAARAKTKTSREIAARLELLQAYYDSDLRRLEAIAETSFLLMQLNPVACPTCSQPIETAEGAEDGEISKEYLEQIQFGARVEANKIRNLGRDLAETLTRANEDSAEASGSERSWFETLEALRSSERAQSRQVAQAHAQLAQTFAAIGQLAERRALKQRRNELQAQLVELEEGPATAAAPVEERTEFDANAIDGLCEVIRKLLIAWKWNYTPGPLVVTFDQSATDIVISGSARSSFGKAVRALLSSAFLLGVMDYCYAKGLPHPGFVVLDSPVTTKKESGKSGQDDSQIGDDLLAAFFTYLAENYSDRQVIIFDNKEPPARLVGKINLIRFDDDPLATRHGFFPD